MLLGKVAYNSKERELPQKKEHKPSPESNYLKTEGRATSCVMSRRKEGRPCHFFLSLDFGRKKTAHSGSGNQEVITTCSSSRPKQIILKYKGNENMQINWIILILHLTFLLQIIRKFPFTRIWLVHKCCMLSLFSYFFFLSRIIYLYFPMFSSGSNQA